MQVKSLEITRSAENMRFPGDKQPSGTPLVRRLWDRIYPGWNILAAVCWMIIAASMVTRSSVAEPIDFSLSSAVFHLNGVRIHSANCGKQPDENLEQQLATALGITQSRRRIALHDYVESIYSQMIATAVRECTPEMLHAYSEGFREKLGEITKSRHERD